MRKLTLVFQFAVILVMFGVLANGYIYLNQKIAETDREIQRVKTDMHGLDREIDNLRIRREQLCAWPHIRQAIARFSLGLRPADPQQVRRLAIVAQPVNPDLRIASRGAETRMPRRTVFAVRQQPQF